MLIYFNWRLITLQYCIGFASFIISPCYSSELCIQMGVSFLFSFAFYFSFHRDFPGGSDGKSICLQCGRPGFDPWVGKIPWRRKWQPTPVLLPGKSHGQRSLAGCSPWGRKELDMTSLSLSLSTSITYRNSAPLQLFIVDVTELHILCAPKHKLTILLDALVS